MVWLTRKRHEKKPRSSSTFWKPTFTRLTVTRLEGRDNPAPTISNLTGQQIGGTWVITGQVNDTNPGRDTVTISGDTNGAAHVYDDGWFDYLVAANGSQPIVYVLHQRYGSVRKCGASPHAGRVVRPAAQRDADGQSHRHEQRQRTDRNFQRRSFRQSDDEQRRQLQLFH